MFREKFKIKLSILIPVFNQDVSALVHSLHSILFSQYSDWEIILLEDGSSNYFALKNKNLESLTNITFIQNPINFGRSITRNTLAKMAQFEHLLFLDGDSSIPNLKFIEEYALHLPFNGVICGGRIYAEQPPDDRDYYLHWNYGTKVESPASFKNFMSNNFLIHKDIFKQIKFDEKTIGYGHEDTLFGEKLKEQKIRILFIKNPIVHLGLEPSKVFLDKTKNAVENLKTLEISTRLTRFKMYFPKGLGQVILPLIEKNLVSKHPSILLFQFFKWIHYHSNPPNL